MIPPGGFLDDDRRAGQIGQERGWKCRRCGEWNVTELGDPEGQTCGECGTLKEYGRFGKKVHG